jgi:hypothetical protein
MPSLAALITVPLADTCIRHCDFRPRWKVKSHQMCDCNWGKRALIIERPGIQSREFESRHHGGGHKSDEGTRSTLVKRCQILLLF